MNIPLYSQQDVRWRSTPLGTYGRTLGSDGCALTSLGMVVGETPDVVLQKAKAQNAVASSGDFSWTAIPGMYPSFRFHFRWSTVNEEKNLAQRKQVDASLESIKTLLALGQPVILRVQHPAGIGHFIVAVDVQWDGDLIVHDPDGGKEIAYKSKYGDPMKSLLAYVVIIGPEREGVDAGPTIDKKIVRSCAGALFKAAQLAAGKNVSTYSKEILDTFL